MMEKGDDDFLYSLIYVFYYSFFAITIEVGLGLINCLFFISKN